MKIVIRILTVIVGVALAYVSITAALAFGYPQEWKHMKEYKEWIELYNILGTACCFGGGVAYKEGKEKSHYTSWTEETRWAVYDLNCVQFDADPEIHYTIYYESKLLPFEHRYAVASETIPFSINPN